jgi:hypothetical protein
VCACKCVLAGWRYDTVVFCNARSFCRNPWLMMKDVSTHASQRRDTGATKDPPIFVACLVCTSTLTVRRAASRQRQQPAEPRSTGQPPSQVVFFTRHRIDTVSKPSVVWSMQPALFSCFSFVPPFSFLPTRGHHDHCHLLLLIANAVSRTFAE